MVTQHSVLRLRAATVAGLVGILSAISLPTALADGTASYGMFSPDDGALVEFQSYGEIFDLFDEACDGRVPRLQYKVGTGGSVSTAENHGGCHSDPLTVNKSYAEGTVIYFRACNVAANYSSCSSWVKATA